MKDKEINKPRPIKFRLFKDFTKSGGGKIMDYDGFFILNGLPHKMSDYDGPKEIKDGILLQWTGLLDSNGADIYEGDIVFTDESKWEVVFDEGLFGLKLNEDEKITPLYEFRDCIIIGNKFQNPELLK